MNLSTLASTVPGARLVGADVTVTDLAYDSRAVAQGTLYLCVPGAHVDGHSFAFNAVGAGAVALVVERELDVAAPQIVVPSVREAMAAIANSFFGEPSRAMRLVGITGTNGKTTTAFMLESVFRALGETPGLIGTVECHIGDEVLPVTRTTPEAIDLQRLLARMRDAGVSSCAMEASSEGLTFGRVEHTWFACSVFTNLTQDHLNTHGTMDAYLEAKAMLFRASMSARAVINVDDEAGRALAMRVGIPLTTFAIDREADVRARSIEMDAAGSTVSVQVLGATFEVRVPVAGRFNVSNALGVIGVGVALGLPLDAVAAGIAALPGVPGRLESIECGQDFSVLVDYAHTPDSLESVLRAARAFTPAGARLVCVVGCGGDRDQGKRPLMGRVVAEMADVAIITSDNSRSEDPLAIIAMIEEGARVSGRAFTSIPDRREAIAAAIEGAHTGDVIVIAGKGHESGQQFADRTIAFDDRVVAREILEALR